MSLAAAARCDRSGGQTGERVGGASRSGMRCALVAGDHDRAWVQHGDHVAWTALARYERSDFCTRVDPQRARGRQVCSRPTTHDLESGVGAGEAATSASASMTLGWLRLAQPAYLCRSWRRFRGRDWHRDATCVMRPTRRSIVEIASVSRVSRARERSIWMIGLSE